MNINTKKIGIALLMTVSLFSCKEKTVEAIVSVTDTIPVKTIAIEASTMQFPVETSGQFTTEDETYLSFKTGGIVKHAFVKEGDAVKKGQLLASLDMTEIQAQVQQAKIAFEKAQRDNQRAGNLYRDSVATLEQFQNSKTALDIAQQQLNGATFNAQYSEIRAGKDGYVLRKFINDGQVIGPGTPAFQVNGAGNQQWVLKVVVSDKDWSSIEKGDQAFITQNNSSSEKVPGKVINKSEGTDPITGTMWVTIKPNSGMLKRTATGSFGKAQIIPSKSTQGWMIPYDAVIDGNSNDGFVFISKDNKTAEKRSIQVGEITNNGVLVTSGLEGISSIIISGNAYLNEGSPIKIIK